MGRASSRYDSATNLERADGIEAVDVPIPVHRSKVPRGVVASRRRSAGRAASSGETAQQITTGARQAPVDNSREPNLNSRCTLKGCCSPVEPTPDLPCRSAACSALFERGVKFRRARRRSLSRVVDSAFAFIHDAESDERLCDSCGFCERQQSEDPLAACDEVNQCDKLAPEQTLISDDGVVVQTVELSNSNSSNEDKASEATGCANGDDTNSTCACSDYCCLMCDLSSLATVEAEAATVSKQIKPAPTSNMHQPHKPQLATIKEQSSPQRTNSTGAGSAIGGGQRQQQRQAADLERCFAAAPAAAALPALVSPLELMRTSSYVALHRSARYEPKHKQQYQQADKSSQAADKLRANINCDVQTLLSGQCPGELSDINWRLINRRALAGDGLLGDSFHSTKTNKLEQEEKKLANQSASQDNNNNNNKADTTGGPVDESSNNNSAQRSHMDWQNIAERFGKMPYRHKGHMWWKLRQSCFCHFILSTLNFLFPFFTSFKGYSLPGHLITDLMTGFTVGILHIPQGMAYGLLAGVDPIYGLYVSIVPVLVMAMMSKSVHMSYGTFAVISILLASCTESVKQSLRQQMALAGGSINQTATSGFLSEFADTSTTSSPMAQQQQLSRKHDLSSSSDNELVGDALVLTNNHRSTDPGQQLLKQLLIPGQVILPGIGTAAAAADIDLDQPSWASTFSQIAPAASSDFIMPSNIEILTCICLLVGLIQMVMALMRLGVLSLMFSDQLVSSFTTASAVHVATSQLGNVFDLNTPRVPEGLFKVCRTWAVFAMKLFEGFNQYTALLSLLSILFLLNVKEIIEPYLKRRYKLATCIPSELVLMSVLVVCSWFWQFNSNYGVHIVGTVPTGLPVPKAPRLDLVPLVVQDALTVAVVSFAMNLSLAQVCAKKFRYRLNPNQELFALGSSNLVGSFFSCFPCASSLSRTAVQSNLNAKSQISSLFSCAIVISVVCYFAPFFYNLPRSTLSCIILVNLKGILVQVKDFFENWRLSKLDALVWLATFMFVLAFDVTYGLILGILTSLSMVFYRLLTPNYSILGQLPDTEIYVDKSAFAECHEIDHVKIFRFNSALCYLNREMFKSGIERLLRSANSHSTGFLCPEQLKQQLQSGCKPNRVDFLIIDCSALSYCDYSGVATLIEIIEELEEQRTIVYLASCPLKLVNMIEKLQKPNVLDHNVYPSITDAINQARYLRSRNVRALSTSLSESADEQCLQSVISVGPSK